MEISVEASATRERRLQGEREREGREQVTDRQKIAGWRNSKVSARAGTLYNVVRTSVHRSPEYIGSEKLLLPAFVCKKERKRRRESAICALFFSDKSGASDERREQIGRTTTRTLAMAPSGISLRRVQMATREIITGFAA